MATSKRDWKRKIKNFNGQQATQPLKDKKQINKLLYYMLDKVELAKTDVKRNQADRNYMLLVVGFNTAFRAEDILQLRVKDLNGYVHIKENKTGKPQNFPMNKQFKKEVDEYVLRHNLTKNSFLFMGQKKEVNGQKYTDPITRQQFYRIANTAAKAIGIDYTFGPHSLRKTFGYHYMNDGGNLITLMQMYNHDSPDVTLLYVCWGKEDIEANRSEIYIGVKSGGSKNTRKD